MDLTDADTGEGRLAIVHYGEHCPLDAGYRPARMGQLAGWLTEAGAAVTRFVPSYSPFAKQQRPLDWSGTETDEGVVQMIPTRAYETSVSLTRAGFLRDFARGTAARAAELPPFDGIIVGYPPPGVVTGLRRSLGSGIPILADIRDLWPDALVPSHRRGVLAVAHVLGHVLAAELRLADGVVAMSPTILRRAPKSNRLSPISPAIQPSLTRVVSTSGSADRFTGEPAGGPAAASADTSTEDGERGLRATFVGSFTQGVDLPALFGGWRLFLTVRDRTKPTPSLVVCGDGERANEVKELTDGLDGVKLLGRVEPSAVREHLVDADVGIAATRPGFGTTFSNKVIEYIGSGLFVLNSLEPESARELEQRGLGQVVPPSPEGWAAGFAAVERRLTDLRRDRGKRQIIAIQHYGRAAIEPRWMAVLNRIGVTVIPTTGEAISFNV